MKFPFIDGQATHPPAQAVVLPTLDRGKQTDPAGYLIDTPLVDAVNVALLLGQPLLLTGDPGTGKTQLAYRVAWELGLGRPLRFDTKSTSSARDLFYSYDTLRRFHAANTNSGSQANRDYMTYNALGQAILLSREPHQVEHVLTPGFQHPGKQRRVVLIDEIDKAPRDFPNDLLNEVENMSFRIPELDNSEISADAALRPILILTSNSERNLPDAFLRRCIYYHIPRPSRERLLAIVRSRMSESPATPRGTKLHESAVDFFLQVQNLNLRKTPASAELINWLQSLVQWGAAANQALKECPVPLRKSLSTLAKTRDDLEELQRFVENYLEQP
ncbi:MAG: MoxR family ATPase [Deltaproteobacteria bacterium]|nr:MoxR family ATPase [Deltaproteobacteria bacterium]